MHTRTRYVMTPSVIMMSVTMVIHNRIKCHTCVTRILLRDDDDDGDDGDGDDAKGIRVTTL